MDFLILIGHICTKDMDHQNELKRHTNHLILSNHAWFMETFPFFILFYKVNNNSKGFHMLQDLDSYDKKLVIFIF